MRHLEQRELYVGHFGPVAEIYWKEILGLRCKDMWSDPSE